MTTPSRAGRKPKFGNLKTVKLIRVVPEKYIGSVDRFLDQIRLVEIDKSLHCKQNKYQDS